MVDWIGRFAVIETKLFVERGLVEDVVLLDGLLLLVGVATRDKDAVSNAHAALENVNLVEGLDFNRLSRRFLVLSHGLKPEIVVVVEAQILQLKKSNS